MPLLLKSKAIIPPVSLGRKYGGQKISLAICLSVNGLDIFNFLFFSLNFLNSHPNSLII